MLQLHFKVALDAPVVVEKKVIQPSVPQKSSKEPKKDERTHEQKVVSAIRGSEVIAFPALNKQELHEKKMQGLLKETEAAYWYFESDASKKNALIRLHGPELPLLSI